MLPSNKNPNNNLQALETNDNITKLIIYEPQEVINNDIGELVLQEPQVIDDNIPELILRDPQGFINNNINLKVNNINVDSSGHFSGSIFGNVDFANLTLKNSGSGDTITGNVGTTSSLAAVIIQADPDAKHVEKARYMNVNEINFDEIVLSEHSAHIKYIEQNLGVKVFFPAGPEGDQAVRIEGMKVIGLTSEGKYLVDGNIEN